MGMSSWFSARKRNRRRTAWWKSGKRRGPRSGRMHQLEPLEPRQMLATIIDDADPGFSASGWLLSSFP